MSCQNSLKSLGRQCFYFSTKHHAYLIAYLKKKKKRSIKNNRRASVEILAMFKSIPRFVFTLVGVKATDNGRNAEIQRK